jgi:hypothetical protein
MYEKLWLLKNVFFEKRSEINNIGMKAILEVVTQFKTKSKSCFVVSGQRSKSQKKQKRKWAKLIEQITVFSRMA